MRRLLVLIVCVFVLSLSIGVAGTKRIVDYEGTHLDTMYGDSIWMSAAEEGMNKVNIVNKTTGESFDRAMLSILFADNTWINGADTTGVGVTDSAIISIYASKGWYKKTVYSARNALPCTLFVELGPEEYLDSSYIAITADSAIDSTGAPLVADDLVYSQMPGYDKLHAMLLDQLWFEYQVYDSCGAGDTLQTTCYYWLRLIEDE